MSSSIATFDEIPAETAQHWFHRPTTNTQASRLQAQSADSIAHGLGKESSLSLAPEFVSSALWDSVRVHAWWPHDILSISSGARKAMVALVGQGFRYPPTHEDLTVFSGLAATQELFDRVRVQQQLEELIDVMSHIDGSAGNTQCYPISDTTRARGRQFLKLLPTAVPLPKVAADEEGALLFFWAHVGEIVVSIENDTMHCFSRRETTAPTYLDDLPFADNDIIPGNVLSVLS